MTRTRESDTSPNLTLVSEVKPVPVMFACLLFGFLDALANFMQGKEVPLIGEVPVQIFQALPYILTCILLAGFIGVATPPKAGGVPYTKER